MSTRIGHFSLVPSYKFYRLIHLLPRRDILNECIQMTLDFYSSSLSSIDSSLSYSLCPILLLDLPSPPSDEPVVNASLWERVEHGVALTYGWLPVHHDPPPRSSPLLFARLLRWPQVSLRVVAVVRFIKILGQPSSPHDHAHRPKPPPPPPPITRSRVRARAPTVGVWRGLEVEEKERRRRRLVTRLLSGGP